MRSVRRATRVGSIGGSGSGSPVRVIEGIWILVGWNGPKRLRVLMEMEVEMGMGMG